MSRPGERAKKVRKAGGVLHQHARRPGLYVRGDVAACGARRDQGAEFAIWSKYVTCADCLRIIVGRRLKAKATLAAIEGAR